MSLTIHFAVTKEDIKKGVRSDATQCPVVLALRRTLPSDAIVHVYAGASFIGNTRAENPGWLTLWIYQYDAGEDVSPFETDLNFK